MNLLDLYYKLLEVFGYQNWWPVDYEYHKTHKTNPKDEIIIGAILTQNTAWKNVEKALDNLKMHKSMSLKKIIEIDDTTLQKLVRPAGFFKRKSKILKDIANMLETKSVDRKTLLNINGIGKETADSILLYAYDKPFFVIDTYTKRILGRIYNIHLKEYDEYAEYIKSQIPKNIDIYKEFHALIVKLAKEYCRKKPQCDSCLLEHNCIFTSINNMKTL